MSDIHELIAQFRRAGAYIELGGGDRVRFKPGNRPLPPGLLDELKARKAEVIAALGGSAEPVRRERYVPTAPNSSARARSCATRVSLAAAAATATTPR